MLPKNRVPIHPGQMLLNEFLKPMHISQIAFAKHIGWTYTKVNKIINEKHSINAEFALAISDAFKMEPQFWLNLQRNWDMWYALRKHKRIRAIKSST